MNILNERLRFPFEDKDWILKLLLGSLICIVPVLNILALGYFFKCAESGTRGHMFLPDWKNWGELLQDGLAVLLVLLFYTSIPLMAGFLISLIPIVGYVLSAILLIIIGTIIPMGVAAYAVRRDLRDAFNLPELWYLLCRVINEYMPAYFGALVMIVVGLSLLFALPFLGIIGGALIFYTGVVFSNYIGMLYNYATLR
ncbi:MAG: DUF4013 domain-containing protein [Bacillota bacterium]|nr:DUF4013 domain-containing protein [Bacillota bacterium]